MSTDPFNTRTSLIQSAVNGSKDAMNRICCFYEPFIVDRLINSKRLQYADANDVTQEILMRLMASLSKGNYDPAKPFRGYLSGIISNLTSEHWRAKKKDKPSSPLVDEFLNDKQNLEEIIDVFCVNESKLHFEFLLKEIKATAVARGFDESSWKAWSGLKLHGKSYQTLEAELGIKTDNLYVIIYRFKDVVNDVVERWSISRSDIVPEHIRHQEIDLPDSIQESDETH